MVTAPLVKIMPALLLALSAVAGSVAVLGHHAIPEISRKDNMRALQFILMVIMLGIASCPLAGCAAIVGTDKAPHEVWEKLAGGEQQDLIVEFDDSAILAQASQSNRAKGIMFDDNDTLRFKAERYAAMKQDAISKLPSGKVEILKNYNALPLMFLRFHSAEALKALLAYPLVVRAYEERKEHLMPQNSRR